MDAKKKRRILIISSILILLSSVTSAFPHKITLPSNINILQVRSEHNFLREVDKETSTYIPDSNIENTIYIKSSNEYHHILQILNSVKYQNCVHTIVGYNNHGEFSDIIRILATGINISIPYGSAHITINGTDYRLVFPHNLYSIFSEVINGQINSSY